MKKGEHWSIRHRILMEKIMAGKSYKEKISRRSKENWKNPVLRKKIIKNLKKKMKTKEYKEKQRKLAKRIWTKEKCEERRKWWTKNRRKRKSIQMKRFITPEIARQISEKMKERYRNHPYLKIKMSREKQEYYENNPEARKNLLVYWHKPERRIKCKDNTIVKSEGERTIDNTLFDAGIMPNYEAVELNFPEMDPTPDFYPEGEYRGEKIENVFIEFYGGHPKAWVSKVKKNKLYKKYKVPVLMLTPYELKLLNFPEYLLNQLVKLSKSKNAMDFKLSKWQLKRKIIL